MLRAIEETIAGLVAVLAAAIAAHMSLLYQTLDTLSIQSVCAIFGCYTVSPGMKCLKLYLMGIVTFNMLKWDMVNGPCN
jgi:hypothetical protein